MPRAGKFPGNPEWLEILETYKDGLIKKDPEQNLIYTIGNAIKGLRDTEERQEYPGQIKVKFVGPKVTAILKKELAKGAGGRPVNGYDSLVSSNGSSSSDLPSSSGDTYSAPKHAAAKYKSKSKAKAREAFPGANLALSQQEAAALLWNKGKGRADQQHQDTAGPSEPRQPSNQALSKAAAVEEAILVGLYTQCDEQSQKIWMTVQQVLTCSEPFLTHAVATISPRLVAIHTRKHVELRMRGDEAMYALTWAGYKMAEHIAGTKGIPPIIIVRNDIQDIAVQPPAARVVLPAQRSLQVISGAPVNANADKHATPMPRPQGIVPVRQKKQSGETSFVSVVPKKRSAPLETEENYKGLTQYMKAPEDAGEAAGPIARSAGAILAHRPVNKRFAASTIAGVFHDKPAPVTAAHTSVLPFNFTYLDGDDNRVDSRSKADFKRDGSGTMLYKMEYRCKQARHPVASIVLDKAPLTRDPPDAEGLTEMGWIKHDKAPASCPGLPSTTTNQSIAAKAVKGPPVLSKSASSSAVQSLMKTSKQVDKNDPRAMYKFPSIDSINFASSPEKSKPAPRRELSPAEQVAVPPRIQHSAADYALIKTIFGGSKQISTTSAEAGNSHTVSSPSVRDTSKIVSASTMSYASSSSSAKQSAPPVTQRTIAVVSQSGKSDIAPTAGHKSHSTPSAGSQSTPPKAFSAGLEDHITFPAFQPIILPAGSFDVVLLFDHREQAGMGGFALEGTLDRRKIKYDRRSLFLGDYLWVAQRKVPLGDAYDQVVLAICERKRKDDFINSIKDERHVDQKNRINAAGITRKFYLVEEFDISDAGGFETFLKSIQTCVNQTLLVDGFQLRTTNSSADTMSQLVRITKALQEEGKDIHVIPDDLVQPGEVAQRQRYLTRTQPNLEHFICSKSFERVDNKRFTLRSVWAKMVCCVCGVTEEQSEQFIQAFPTPADFFAEMEEVEVLNQARLSQSSSPENESNNRKKRKLDASDPKLYVKNRLDKAYRPRPMNNPTSERFYNLAISADYNSLKVLRDDS